MVTRICILVITLYQRIISPLFPGMCRFRPTCSEYAIESLKKYGCLKGCYHSIWRIMKCHPFHPGGYDPIDE